MLANFFGKSNPINVIIIWLIFLAFFIAIILESFSGKNIDSSLLLYYISIILLFMGLFFGYTFILEKNKLTLYNSYGFLFFALFFGFFPETMLDRTEVIFNLGVLIFLRKIYSFRTAKEMHKKIFDSGFWLGILFLMEPRTAIFGILVIVSIVVFQKITMRKFLISLVGFIVPVFCYFSYCFWDNSTAKFEKLFIWYSDYNFEIYNTNSFIIPLVILGVFTLISIILKTPKVFSISGSYRKYWILIILNFLVAMTVILTQNKHKSTKVMLLFFPMSIILANWLEGIKTPFYKNLFLALFIGSPFLLFFIF